MQLSILNRRVSGQDYGHAISPGDGALCRTGDISLAFFEQLRTIACRPPYPHACQLQVIMLNGRDAQEVARDDDAWILQLRDGVALPSA
jgi:hypothetical protein